MISTPVLPGVRFETVGRRPSPSPLRSDVAGFIGRTRRGPVGMAMRVEGMREYLSVFGGLTRNETFAYAMRAYFENGGQVAHVVRVHADDRRCASVEWQIGSSNNDQKWNLDFPTAGGFLAPKYRIVASSPGTWAVGLKVTVNYELSGPGDKPAVSMTVECAGESTEQIRRIVPSETEPGKRMEDVVASQSKLIRVESSAADFDLPVLSKGVMNSRGPHSLTWKLKLGLSESSDDDSDPRRDVAEEYKDAIILLGDQTEVAILATPSVYGDILEDSTRQTVFESMVREAVDKQDRLVLIDAPPQGDKGESIDSIGLISFVQGLRKDNPSPISQRAAALYHPWLRVNDPLGGVANPLFSIPPSGHVAGVISRVDRERGAHYTPANVPVMDAVDVETSYDRGAGGPLNAEGVNLIRCVPGKGLMVWGGRTIDLSRDGRFVAHRRYIHRLIRAIRRVADPVVFDTNGPELWLILVRAISTVLLEAFRGGALQGARPEESFRVRCDENTSPLFEREQGRVFCEIDLALAAPMEFITIRVSVSKDGQVEVFDA